MFAVALSEMQHGAQPADVHLITSVQLAQGSSVVFTGAGYHHVHYNAIIEAEYFAPPATTPLHHDGLTHLSTLAFTDAAMPPWPPWLDYRPGFSPGTTTS
jgi:hypothetical protein